MGLSNIFEKPVDRHIEGVIKADDEASLKLEVEEYVLTNEIAQKLETFFDAYTDYQGANGVWISGFFGSGKSHLLKMLALLMENRAIDGASTLEEFLPKCGDNEFLLGGLKRSTAIHSKSILFNIDQKADVISKTQIDALLSVFVKVFDEMCGYYGKQGHIAKFERDLDDRGQFGDFKKAYKDISGQAWEFGREQAILEAKNIAETYAKVTGGNDDAAIGVLDKYRADYKVSIGDFADQVQAYIEKQGADFRLNFFVDEVGQYIADNVKLMTNLQTIAESLATKSRGRAWIIVTAQEDMSSVTGEMTEKHGNDFTKIQARFKNALKLTSTDVAEVVQRRLLKKNSAGASRLADLYKLQVNNFKTLFDFADGSASYRNFKDEDHFVFSYPFIPYQFELFQSAIQNLSVHNAFEGKHSSVGERSMLGVFQQVAIQISGHEIGQLATFDLMFEGIRAALKSQIQHSILMAERNLDNKFAIRILKALFLVKYVKEYKATVRNLCILMLDSFDADIPALTDEVKEALNLLEQQTYIQRNGEEYEYLTDEEKDVEQEIKNTPVETADVSGELGKVIFDHIIRSNKIRYEDNKQDYPFSKKLDDQLLGREHELAIHIISPFHEHSGNQTTLLMQSMGRNELLVFMPSEDRLVRDLLMYKRTEKYIRQNTNITQQDSIKKILAAKGFQNTERRNEIQELIRKLIGQSDLFYSGQKLDVSAREPQARIILGFGEVILRVYPNLKMLRGITYKETDIANYIKQSGSTLFGTDAMALGEAEQEMQTYIQGNNRSGVRTTLKNLVDNFERKPYGWYLAAILCTLAKLCAQGKIEVHSDGNILEDSDLANALLNTHGHSNVILEPQVDFTSSQIRNLKKFIEEMFDTPAQSTEAKALGKEAGLKFRELHDALTPLASQVGQFPFLRALEEPVGRLKELSGKPYAFYLTELASFEDELLDQKESLIAPIRRFMGGSQKSIYIEAQHFLQSQQPNFDYVDGDDHQKIKDILSAPDCYKGNKMQQLKALVDGLKAKIASFLESQKTKAIETINRLKEQLAATPEYSSLSPEQQGQVARPFDGFSHDIGSQTLIAVIRETTRRFEEMEFQRVLSKMTTIVNTQADAGGAEPKVEYILLRSIQVNCQKPCLENEQDVEKYVGDLKNSIMAEIKKGKRVQI